MADITHSSPVVTEDKLTEFYEDIKPYLGCPAYVTQEGDAEYYSTDEKVIGKWIDDKPLYQKTFVYNGTVTCNQVTTTVEIANISSLNVDTVVDLRGRFFSNGGNQERVFNNVAPLGGTASDVQQHMVNTLYVSKDTHLLQMQTRRDTGSIIMSNIVAIMKYTKTTDSAVTTIEQKSTHYSTTEQVVGTWVDGKPIYQKTVVGVSPTTTTDGTLVNGEAIAISEVCAQVVKVEMTIENNSDPIGTGQQMIMTNAQYFVKVNCERGTYPKFGVRPVNNCTRFNGLNLYITVQYTKTTD